MVSRRRGIGTGYLVKVLGGCRRPQDGALITRTRRRSANGLVKKTGENCELSSRSGST